MYSLPAAATFSEVLRLRPSTSAQDDVELVAPSPRITERSEHQHPSPVIPSAVSVSALFSFRHPERSERERTQSKDPRESRNAVTRLHGLPPTWAAAPGAQKRWLHVASPLVVGAPSVFPRRERGFPCSHAGPVDAAPVAATPSVILRLRPSAPAQDDGRGRRPCLPQ